MGSGRLPSYLAGLSGPVSVFVGVLMLGMAPLIRGGNRHVALVLLECLALIVLLAQGIERPHRTGGTNMPTERLTGLAIGVLVLAPLWAAFVQLIPLPATLWDALPGRAVYADAIRVAQVREDGFRPPSLAPDFTVLSLLAGLPLSAAFLLAYRSSAPQLQLLIHSLIGFAAAQAVLGLLQMGSFQGLYFGAAAGGRAIGTFANPNHFANYIAMTVPLTVLFLRQAVTASRKKTGERRSRQPVAVVLGVTLFLLLAAVLASGSRGGTVTTLVVTLLAVWLLRRRRSHRSEHRWGLAGVAALLALVAIAVGMDALLSRFEADKSGYFVSDRWHMVVAAWHGALVFWPFGSGMGTFASVFPAFHPVGLRGFVEHAHNDYVQLLMEGGLLVVVLLLVALALVFRQIARLLRRDRQSGLDPQAQLQAACGLGLLAIVLHSWVDFNLRIPANGILAAFLLGAFLRQWPEHSSPRREYPDVG